MILKAIDLSLMAEHIMTHKGVVAKLKQYYCAAQSTVLKQLLYEQIVIMTNHVRVMLALMDPERNETVTVSALQDLQTVPIRCGQLIQMNDETITLEAHTTAKTMAEDNFHSSLRMKAQNVKDIHAQMAYQQYHLQKRYAQLITDMGWENAPTASLEEQVKTMQAFQKSMMNSSI